jgi:protein-disulfide isomerase
MRCAPRRRPSAPAARGNSGLLFEHQQHLKQHHLFEYAQSLDLDMARFKAEMDDEIYLQRVRDNQQSGDASGVRATPTFFVNGRLLDVSYGLHALLDAVEQQLKAGTGTGAARAAR